MPRSNATSPEAYLTEIEPERAEALRAVREVINRHLPPGYEEAMNWGMIAWQVPLAVYPDTYNKQPLLLAALANQKNHLSLYLLPVYGDSELRAMLEGAGKRLKMGKSCINFSRSEELPLDTIGEIIGRCDVAGYVDLAKQARRR